MSCDKMLLCVLDTACINSSLDSSFSCRSGTGLQDHLQLLFPLALGFKSSKSSFDSEDVKSVMKMAN